LWLLQDLQCRILCLLGHQMTVGQNKEFGIQLAGLDVDGAFQRADGVHAYGLFLFDQTEIGKVGACVPRDPFGKGTVSYPLCRDGFGKGPLAAAGGTLQNIGVGKSATFNGIGEVTDAVSVAVYRLKIVFQWRSFGFLGGSLGGLGERCSCSSSSGISMICLTMRR